MKRHCNRTTESNTTLETDNITAEMIKHGDERFKKEIACRVIEC